MNMNQANTELNAYLVLMGAENTAKTPKNDLIATLRDGSSELSAALFALYAQAMGSASASGGADDWVKNFDFAAASPLARVAWVYDESETVEARIDALFDGADAALKAALIDTLVRAQIAWAHPSIDAALEDDATRQAAAWLVAHGAPESLNDWLLDNEAVEDVLDGLRALSLSDTDLGAGDWSAFEQWQAALTDAVMGTQEAEERADFEAALARVTGPLAVLDPAVWARLALGGDADSAWLKDPQVVADFLQSHGPASWLEALCILDATDDPAAEFGALLAVAATSGLDDTPPDEDAARGLIQLLQLAPDAPETAWEPLAARLGLATAIALTGADDAAPDDGLGLLLVQVAAHERLLHHGYHSPGISGLPHSPSDPEDISLEASLALLSDLEEQTYDLEVLDPDTTVMILRNCLDLHRHLDANPEQFEKLSQDWADAFAASASPALALASRGLFARLAARDAALEQKTLAQAPDLGAALVLSRLGDEDPRVIQTLAHHGALQTSVGLDCARRLAENGTPQALESLATLWATADCLRAPFFARCLQDAIENLADAE
ncbi:hypothetical protein [Bradymonas sediminis]|uniref:Uncharacterized protein n=1 Tax=Bradymonas sediminis TaxID=1548548 RepID=A0A2Z4FRF8_9DELT|nr:hypothetical protein [Bradymonas sediminis]AWV91305.1 hypothetical protein DN745_19040 [Bradymonas sediminis]TDP73881.1 hypothetical protein DFR33_105215 [Bradymonas sediminis]